MSGVRDAADARWRMLALLAAAELLGMSLWFSGSAIAPALAAQWSLSPAEIGLLATMVQLGFVAGTAITAVTNLADIVPSRTLFTISVLLAAASNAMLVVARSFPEALVTRALVGCFLAGVYPPAMKMAATWFRERRGLAVATIVGALTVGKAAPYLLRSAPRAAADSIVLIASTGAVIGGMLVWSFYRDGPFAFASRPFSWGLVGDVVRSRRWRLATGGYLGHMAELYSYWTWIPAFLLAHEIARSGGASAGVSGSVSALAFGVIAIGGLGCIWGGLVADRIGRARLVTLAMTASGGCAIAIGIGFGRSWWLVAPLALAWGFFVIADSAQFSVLVTESVPPHAVGTALALQTSLGFLLTTLTIQLVPYAVDHIGWRWAFAMLAIGPALGIWSIARLGVEPGRRQ